METNNDQSRDSDENNSHTEKSKKKSDKRRGPTTGKYISEDNNGPYRLKWNEQGVSTGEFKDKYTAYTGALARGKVKIWIRKWSDVDNDVKEKMWTAVKVI